MPVQGKQTVVTPKVVLLACVALVAVVAIGSRLPRPESPVGVVAGPPALRNVLRPPPQPLRAFSDVWDQDGQPFGVDRLRNHWTLVFFGYTSCPDICPTTLAVLREVADQPEMPTDVQCVFISVDPRRDGRRRVGDYVRYFDPEFIGVTGEPARIKALMKQFNVMAVRESGGNPGTYTIAHTSSIMLVDPKARLVGAFSPPHNVQDIVEKFQAVRDYLKE